MDNLIEHQYLVTQLNANESIRNLTNQEIAQFSIILKNKRELLKQLDEFDLQIHHRINALNEKNKYLVKYHP